MYDCWNEAVAYLKNKYGTRDVPIGMNFSGGLTIGATRTRATNTCGIAQTYKTHKMINDLVTMIKLLIVCWVSIIMVLMLKKNYTTN
jgi:hypothetical protein